MHGPWCRFYRRSSSTSSSCTLNTPATQSRVLLRERHSNEETPRHHFCRMTTSSFSITASKVLLLRTARVAKTVGSTHRASMPVGQRPTARIRAAVADQVHVRPRLGRRSRLNILAIDFLNLNAVAGSLEELVSTKVEFVEWIDSLGKSAPLNENGLPTTTTTRMWLVCGRVTEFLTHAFLFVGTPA